MGKVTRHTATPAQYAAMHDKLYRHLAQDIDQDDPIAMGILEDDVADVLVTSDEWWDAHPEWASVE